MCLGYKGWVKLNGRMTILYLRAFRSVFGLADEEPHSSFPVIHKVVNIDIFVLLILENKMEREIIHLKIIQSTMTNVNLY